MIKSLVVHTPSIHLPIYIHPNPSFVVFSILQIFKLATIHPHHRAGLLPVVELCFR
jgi:hypothetical protein